MPHPSCVRSSRLVVALTLSLALPILGAAAAEHCADGPFDATALPHLCESVQGAPEGSDNVTVRAVDRTALATLTLRPPTGPDGLRDLVGTLPNLAGHASLTLVDAEELWPCSVRVDDRAARIAPVSFSADDGGASLILADRPPDGTQPADALALLFLYADRSVRIDATCDVEPQPLHVALSLAEGWNVIVSEMLGAPGGRGTVSLRNATADDFARVSWHWSVHPFDTHGAPPTVRPAEPPTRR